MTSPTPARPSSAFKILGIVLLVVGVFPFLTGLGWIVTFYGSQGQLPVPDVGNGNIVIGFVLMLPGLVFAVVGIVLLSIHKRRSAVRA